MSHKSDNFMYKARINNVRDMKQVSPQRRLLVPSATDVLGATRYSALKPLLTNLSAADRRLILAIAELCTDVLLTRRCVAGCTVTDASKDCSAFIFGVKQFNNHHAFRACAKLKTRALRSIDSRVTTQAATQRHILREPNPQQSRSQNLKNRKPLILWLQQRAEIFLIT